jgi:DnaD/phage-associated family protein
MLNGTRKLSDAECGRLFRALLCYSAGADVGQINLQGREEVLFDVYSQQIDRDAEAYEVKVAKSRENGGKGGRPKKNQEVNDENLKNPQVFFETQKTQDKDKEKDKDKDKEKDKGKDKDNTASGIYAAAADDRPDFNTVEAYAANNLAAMNGGNMVEFAMYKDDLPDELIRHAIDEACAQGKRTWGYVRSILNRYRDSGFKTVGDVQKAAEERKKGIKTAANNPAGARMNYQQREYSNDFGFYDPSEDYA